MALDQKLTKNWKFDQFLAKNHTEKYSWIFNIEFMITEAILLHWRFIQLSMCSSLEISHFGMKNTLHINFTYLLAKVALNIIFMVPYIKVYNIRWAILKII